MRPTRIRVNISLTLGGCPYPDCPSHTQSHEELSPHYDLIDSINSKEGGGGRRSRGPYSTNSLKLRGKSLGDNVFLDDGDPNLANYYESSVQMLPIFQRLIEDKRGGHGDTGAGGPGPGGGDGVGGKGSGGGVSGSKGSKGAFKTKSANAASCPNISLRCDIVEYL